MRLQKTLLTKSLLFSKKKTLNVGTRRVKEEDIRGRVQ